MEDVVISLNYQNWKGVTATSPDSRTFTNTLSKYRLRALSPKAQNFIVAISERSQESGFIFTVV